MRAGKNRVQVHIIRIFRGMIGTGRQMLRTEINTAILGRLLGPVHILHYRITTRSLAWTGMLFLVIKLQPNFDKQRI